jgi:hypothetical protein
LRATPPPYPRDSRQGAGRHGLGRRPPSGHIDYQSHSVCSRG